MIGQKTLELLNDDYDIAERLHSQREARYVSGGDYEPEYESMTPAAICTTPKAAEGIRIHNETVENALAFFRQADAVLTEAATKSMVLRRQAIESLEREKKIVISILEVFDEYRTVSKAPLKFSTFKKLVIYALQSEHGFIATQLAQYLGRDLPPSERCEYTDQTARRAMQGLSRCSCFEVSESVTNRGRGKGNLGKSYLVTMREPYVLNLTY